MFFCVKDTYHTLFVCVCVCVSVCVLLYIYIENEGFTNVYVLRPYLRRNRSVHIIKLERYKEGYKLTLNLSELNFSVLFFSFLNMHHVKKTLKF